jgi:hypothetical protein
MADKKEVTGKTANVQRSRIKKATDQDGVKLEADKIDSVNTQAASPSDARSLLGIVLDDRAIQLYPAF